MLNGLEGATSGEILINHTDIKHHNINSLRREFYGYVFQKVGLFPHMTVKQNMEIVLRINKKPLESWKETVDKLLSLVQLDPPSYRERYPDQLSGGEQQRVGVARALATDSECLLMDEPFGALDAVTRCELQDHLLRIKSKLKKTLVFVTHDIGEAFKIGDRIVVMRNGVVEQVGIQEQLIQSPATPFVEQLIQGQVSGKA